MSPRSACGVIQHAYLSEVEDECKRFARFVLLLAVPLPERLMVVKEFTPIFTQRFELYTHTRTQT
jgi:hypothetical protein